MAKFDVDVQGVTYEVDAPDENTAWKWANQTHKSATPQKPTQDVGAMARIGQGMRDPIDGGAQLLTKMLPDGVVNVGNKVNNWLADKTGLVGRLPEGGVDQQVREREQAYQAARTADGQSGIDGWRLTGNVVSPANLALASKVPQAAKLAGKVGYGAASGLGFGLLSPVTEGDFVDEKLKQGATGMAAGAVAPAIMGGMARVVSPQTREPAKKLMQEGVTPTVGQILGGRAQVLEDKLTSVPVLGDAISSARKKGLDEFNRAAYARALDPIAGNVPKEAGRTGVESVKNQLGDAYDALLPNMSFKSDPIFKAEQAKIASMVASLPKRESREFNAIIERELNGRLTSSGLGSGDTLKTIESQLGKEAGQFSRATDAYQQKLGAALKEVQSSFRSAVERANPQYSDELGAINKGYANYARVRDAASRQGSEGGKFTPAQLAAAVRGQDRTAGKGGYATGNAYMQDLSDAGKDVLSSKYPDSGSIGRLLMGLGTVGGGAAINPVAAGVAGLSTLPYLPGGRQLAAALLARRPEGAEEVAKVIRKLGPAATPALIGLTQPTQQ